MTEDLSFEFLVSMNWKGPGANVTGGLIMIMFFTQSRQLPGDAGKLPWDRGHVEDPEQAGTGGKAAAHRWEVGGLCHRDIITSLRGGWSLSSWHHHIAERWVVFVIVTWSRRWEVGSLCHCDMITSLRGRIFVMAFTHHWQVGVGEHVVSLGEPLSRTTEMLNFTKCHGWEITHTYMCMFITRSAKNLQTASMKLDCFVS